MRLLHTGLNHWSHNLQLQWASHFHVTLTPQNVSLSSCAAVNATILVKLMQSWQEEILFAVACINASGRCVAPLYSLDVNTTVPIVDVCLLLEYCLKEQNFAVSSIPKIPAHNKSGEEQCPIMRNSDRWSRMKFHKCEWTT